MRSEAQAQALSKLGINVLRLDLSDEESVVESLHAYDSTEVAWVDSRPTEVADPFLVRIVIHTASSIDPQFALHLITALGKRKHPSGQETYFIHVIIHLIPFVSF